MPRSVKESVKETKATVVQHPKTFLFRCSKCESEALASEKAYSHGDPTRMKIMCEHCDNITPLDYVGEAAPNYKVVVHKKPPSTLDMKVVYPELKILEHSVTSPAGPLGPNEWKVILGWETEEDYQKRMVEEEPDSKPTDWLFGDFYHCLDTKERKVRCWNNANNRPFDMSWCEDIREMILLGQWAGPHTLPGETVNGETVRVSRYGRVLSGQHQGTGCILADEELQASRKAQFAEEFPKYPFWNGHDHLFIETILITGLSEDERVLQTIDYVKPRSVADMLYTRELYRGNTPSQRKELTRVLASAIDMLWERTATRGYKTHPEVVGFLERHKRLLKCAEYIFNENKADAPDGGRRIAKLRVQPGVAAALLYIMGCSGDETDGDAYRNEFMQTGIPPSERNLDWTLWDRACEFWTGLASLRSFTHVRTALNRLKDSSPLDEDNQGQGGRLGEKLAIIQKAWDIFKDHPEEAGDPFNEDDLEEGGALDLNYSDLDDKGNKLKEGQIKLVDVADFGGIDCPKSTGEPHDPPAPTGEDYEAMKEAERNRRYEEEDAKAAKRSARK